MRDNTWSYFGLWWSAVVLVLLFGTFLLFVPFYRKNHRKPAGAFLAFITAFALEMHGVPLSFYFVIWAFEKRLPEGIFWGHTLSGNIGATGHYLYLACILSGAGLIVGGWARVYRDYWSRDENAGCLVKEGLYKYIRHPQYAGFLLISLGVLFEWATIPLVLMWPVLARLYHQLARSEEKELEEHFGTDWHEYRERTGMYLPRFLKKS